MSLVDKIEQLEACLRKLETVTIAVSGGIDSMLLSYIAQSVLGSNAYMVHAESPAVPSGDTQRIKDYANRYNWQLKLVQSGEMKSSEYRSNPVNRCYYCKTCLYRTLASLGSGQVISGTNLDDLSDYRPGLIAAEENDVVHPYVEVGIDKKTIRDIARYFQLNDLSDLPSSPCLSSRIETGVYIYPEQLSLVGEVESMVKARVSAENIRCRYLANQITLELDDAVLATLSGNVKQDIVREVQSITASYDVKLPVHLTSYLRGSAFVRNAI